VARDPDTIERDIERARDALAGTVNELFDRANPKRLVDGGKEAAKAKFADPKVKFALLGVFLLILLFLLRKIFR